jgi:hypothetical protein
MSRYSSQQAVFFVSLIAVVIACIAVGFGAAGYSNSNAALGRPIGYGNAFTEASTSVVNLTDAPGVTSLFAIFGCSIFPSGTGFGSMSGTIEVDTPGPIQIQFTNVMSTVVGVPVSVGSIPGLVIVAIDGTAVFPVEFDVFPDPHDILLVIENITVPGTYSFTQPFFGVSKD